MPDLTPQSSHGTSTLALSSRRSISNHHRHIPIFIEVRDPFSDPKIVSKRELNQLGRSPKVGLVCGLIGLSQQVAHEYIAG